MRKTFLILGAFLAFVFGIGIYIFLQFTRPIVVEVPVAVSNIPAGTVLRSNMFRVAQFANADPSTVSQWITVQTWNSADGKVTSSDIRAGFPIAKSQIDTKIASQIETRLSMLLTDTNQYYVVIPIGPDAIGNYIQPGDRVDIILNIGGGGQGGGDLTIESPKTANANEGTGGNAAVGAQSEVTLTTKSPVSKLIMQNLKIIRIDRTAPSQGNANQPEQGSAAPTPVPQGTVQRMYIEVDKDQLEVLSFVMNNGKNNYAVRAANGNQDNIPTDGVTWNDFVRWFYAQRGNDPNGAQPFDAISPSQQKPTGK